MISCVQAAKVSSFESSFVKGWPLGNGKTTVLIVDMERKDKDIPQIQNSILKEQKDRQTKRDGSNKNYKKDIQSRII